MSELGVDDVRKAIRGFILERDWDQFHSPENLAKSISIEAAELLELFQWGRPERVEDVHEELADVLTYCFQLADKLGVDPLQIMMDKLERSAVKYPVDKARGRSTRNDQLPD